MSILGIDLGTTNSLACVWKGKEAILIPNAFGSYLTPSVVSFLENGEVLVGEGAKQRLHTHPSLTFAEFKRCMGTDTVYTVHGKTYYPQDLSAMVIRKLVEDASVFLNERIEEAIISVPAYFNDDQRWATKIAGQLAGIRVERIINEPSAAALSQHIQQTEEDMLALVVDFGGGTLDISIVEAFDNVVEIRAISGDNHLGGSDFDEAIMDCFLEENGLQRKELLPQELALLKTGVERAKMLLSVRKEYSLQLFLHQKNCCMELNRGKMTAICMPLLQRMQKPLERVLKDSEISLQELQKVILVGGSCRMPVVIQYLEFLLKRDVFLSDICPFTLGLAVYDDGARDYVMEPIIERNTALPCSVNRMFSYRSTSGELQTSILQGEHRKAAANLVVRTVRIKVPKTSEEYQPISVRFTYDINGLLEVETNTFHEESASRVVIQNRMNRMSEEEVHQRLRELQAYKLPSQEKEVYRHLLERGERMYSESIGEKRMRIAALLEEFEAALQQEQPQHIREVFRRVKSALDEWEVDAVSFFS